MRVKWEAFKYYWRFDWTPERKSIGTPLFALSRSCAANAFRRAHPISGWEFGWRFFFLPSKWNFDVAEGELMYRYEFEHMSYIPRY